MTENDLPDWATEMDEEILEMLNIGWTFTPTVISDNIDRSREAVSRRLNTLEAGGLVEKVDRGKYRITEEADGMMAATWKRIEVSEEERREMAKEDYEQRKRIEEEFGVSQEEYLKAVSEEANRLEYEENIESEESLSMAFSIIEERLREQN